MIGRASFGRQIALIFLLFLAVILSWTGTARAHDVRPAYLQIEPLGPDLYTLLWRTPVLSGVPLPVVLDLPENAIALSEPTQQHMPGTTVERRAIEVPGGLAGKRIGFIGLEATITDVLVRISDGKGGYATTLVRPSNPWVELDPNLSSWAIAVTYIKQGIEHILLGFDHLLFVASLLLILRNWKMVVKTITSFTVAHSITLALATLGLVHLPSGPVEIMIAASIVLVAIEAVRFTRGETSITIARPWLVAFVFGLLHGFGFAGALAELGLPKGDIPLALLSFNVGVELGQLAFVAVVLGAIALVKQLVTIPRRALLFSCYSIGIISTFWVFERLYFTFI
ncbi:HupE/UreJ family protein [Falsihalocynthiibacter arcticus]|uniref:HupE / UreJ protein n=1 Tax=Falsihalocynthiibacter arcticus TaxID=1579316 RepID=A0A126V522_9RHOB|nr:HupE/UreJ family protein [Falsihalocynthiibacter arcticus]AML53402.1 HupE / UreJ protein [Falsihalocynthiibacter arcticus]